jgi:hypothetical protein
MQVLNMEDYRRRPVDPETVAVLRYLERLAFQGELEGVAIAFKSKGQDLHAFTGEYKDNSAYAARAANWLSMRLNEAAGVFKKRSG